MMTLSWFKNYLQDHNFHAVVEDMISQEKTINYSVSQGSLLGPVLFNCYHSTLHEEIPKHYSSMAMLMITLCKYHLNLVWFQKLESKFLLENSMLQTEKMDVC